MKKVNILPCSGSGKALGTVSRWAAFELVRNLKPEDTQLTCLARMFVYDDETTQRIRENYNITLDGCPKKCASNLVQNKGGKVDKGYMVAKFLVKNRDLKINTKNVANPGKDAEELARRIAKDLAADVEELLSQDSKEEVNEA